jgi:large subunit ribosomal protein L31
MWYQWNVLATLNGVSMKKDIHPNYYPEARVECACGNVFTIGATMPKISVEICSKCHPFYSGKEKVIDTAGRVEKFRARREKGATTAYQTKTAKRAKRAAAKQEA